GARASRMGHWEALSLGAGMNARGAMEIILATIGLSVGVLTQDMYSIIVVTAIVTSLMAPPILRWTLGKIEMGEEEQERLEAEDRERESFVGNLKRVLLPTTGGAASRLAARLVGKLVGGQNVEVTVIHVRPVGGAPDEKTDEEVDAEMEEVESHLDLPSSEVRRVVRDEEGALGPVVLAEADRGYDLLVIGTVGQRSRTGGPTFTQVVDDVIQDAPCPVLVVRATTEDADQEEGDERAEGAESLHIHRVLLPVFGTEGDRHAAEVSFALARDPDMVVDVVHVVKGGERRARLSDDEAIEDAREVGKDLVGKIADLGHTLGATVHTDVIIADHDEEAIVERAGTHVDLVVMAGSHAGLSQRAFFGHTVDYVVRNAPCPVVVIATP
ncbi:MAG TPA: universal stress protein, partial [Acidimicrobiales bacterium]|nr:universal stress protein [Acidimicrobiales bacterium]